VTAKATRRRFTLDYKRKIVQEADRCKTSGAVGALCAGRAVLVAPYDVACRARAWGSGWTDGREEARPRPANPRSARQANRRVGASQDVLAETRRARRSPDRSPRKHRGVAGDAGEPRALLIAAVTTVGPRLAIASTCVALGVPRATYCRRRRKRPPRRLPAPPAMPSVRPFSPCCTSRDPWIPRRPRSTRRCSTRVGTSAPSAPCIALRNRAADARRRASWCGGGACRRAGDVARRRPCRSPGTIPRWPAPPAGAPWGSLDQSPRAADVICAVVISACSRGGVRLACVLEARRGEWVAAQSPRR
jgi:hypothetical protein